MTKRNNLARNVGRNEFLAVREKILALIAAGYNRRAIYDQLSRQEMISMSFSTFCHYFKRLAKVLTF